MPTYLARLRDPQASSPCIVRDREWCGILQHLSEFQRQNGPGHPRPSVDKVLLRLPDPRESGRTLETTMTRMSPCFRGMVLFKACKRLWALGISVPNKVSVNPQLFRFAYHGTQDATSPTDSGLCLADRRHLKLRDMIAVSRPHGGLAFSLRVRRRWATRVFPTKPSTSQQGCCSRGMGGSLGRCGRSAISLRLVWQGQLFRNGTRPDHREASRAVHEAIERL